jgi:hypothetical protein
VDLGSNATARPPRVYVFGGGYIGFSTSTTALVGSMDGKVDAFFTRDGVTWRQVNYQEGGGTSPLSLYSSQEWAKTTIEGSIVYVGLWGMTVLPFDSSSAGTVSIFFGFLSWSTLWACVRSACRRSGGSSWWLAIRPARAGLRTSCSGAPTTCCASSAESRAATGANSA